MSNLQIFENAEFGKVRTVEINGEGWLVGKDVAEILGYSNASKAVSVHVDEEDRRKEMLEAQSQNGNVVTQTTLINESGMYALVFGSKLPTAKKFKRWVTSEVLPQIRKTGSYQKPMTLEQQMAQGLLAAQKVLAEKDKQIAEMAPKVLFADAVSASKTSILIGELAKLIKQNGHEIGQKRLFAWMREHGYLMKTGSSKNLPTQRSMEMKLFEIKETTINNPDGSIRVTKTPKVTGKSQLYFINKFMTA